MGLCLGCCPRESNTGSDGDRTRLIDEENRENRDDLPPGSLGEGTYGSFRDQNRTGMKI